jgi:iron complex outermembrane receptor protein
MKLLFALLIFLTTFSTAFTQGKISGKVNDISTNLNLANITVSLDNGKYSVQTDMNGEFSFTNLIKGKYSVSIVSTLYEDYAKEISLSSGENKFIYISLKQKPFKLNDILVYGVSKNFEKITESPSAVNVLYSEKLKIQSRGNQIAGALQGLTGIDVLKNGATDFIVNTRGFNSGLNRRILVLQDGRDVSMPLLGAIEWNAFSFPIDDYSRIEFIRGPSASLYGANAFNGVLNMTSYSPKEILGTKASLIGGEYNTFRADVRHAGLITNNLSYKVTLGRSQSRNLSNRRDSVKFLEYPGLPLESKPLTEDDRHTYSNYGTLRFDYDLNEKSKLRLEGGYSNNANEVFVFGLGRTFVKNTERPYVLASYNSNNLNIQTSYMKRHTLDTMWLLVPRQGSRLGAPLLDNSEDILLDAQYNFSLRKQMQFVFGISQQFQNINTYGTSIPFEVKANYTGMYGQLTYSFNEKLKFVGTLRFDRTNIHESQLSPRGAIVYSPGNNHQIRFSVSKSFQRPNYSELYRLTPDAPAFKQGVQGPPQIALLGIDKIISDTLKALTGQTYNIKTNLDGTRSYAVGNENLSVEKNIGIELGYNGSLFDKLFITTDIYYNFLNDFVTTFLPGVNKNIPQWKADLGQGLEQYNNLATSLVYNQLSPRDRTRLSVFNGLPAFVVSNANVGKVEQYGIEFGVNYLLTAKLMLGGNYSYYGFNISKSSSDPDLLPNTSPHKFTLSASYIEPQKFDVNISLIHSQEFDWLAGTFVGVVPTYNIVNLNAGYYIAQNLNIGLNVYNLFNEEHYEIFGGTYMPRYTTARISYNF